MKKKRIALFFVVSLFSTTLIWENVGAIEEVKETGVLDAPLVQAVEKVQTLQVNFSLQTDHIEAFLGETGKIEVADFEGIPLEGIFQIEETSENTSKLIQVTGDGQWKANSSGTSQVKLQVELTKESIEKIQNKFPKRILQVEAMQKTLSVSVQKANKSVTIPQKEKERTIQHDFLTNKVFLYVSSTETSSYLNPFKGIELQGKFIPITDNALFSLSENGYWAPKKIGKTSVEVHFIPSKATIEAIQKKYPAERINLDEWKQTVQVTVGQQHLTMTLDPYLYLKGYQNFKGEIRVPVGYRGKMKVEDYEGVPLRGKFLASKGLFVEQYEDGTWVAKKPGKAYVYLTITLSKKTYQKLKDKFPGYNFLTPEVSRMVPVTIYDPHVKKQSKETPKQGTSPLNEGQELPKTGEENQPLRWIGHFISVSVVVCFYQTKKNQKRKN